MATSPDPNHAGMAGSQPVADFTRSARKQNDPTREAAQTDSALRQAACLAVVRLRADNGWGEVTDGQLVDAVLASFLASPPDWLTALVQRNHAHACDPKGGENKGCLAVPPALRSAAGLERP